jgi:hypothetical protein
MPRLVVEFLVFFWIAPFAIAAVPSRYAPPIPILWIAAIATLIVLRRSKDVDRSMIWGAGGILAGLKGVMLRFCIFGPLMVGFAWLMEPEHFLSLPRERPLVWVVILLLYPIFSVIPQGIVYRSFFCQRYRPLFGEGWLMILVAAASFAIAHIVMHRWEPVLMTFVGGLIMTRTMLRRRSGLLADAEHALYGDLAFTLGLGVWIYVDAARQGL